MERAYEEELVAYLRGQQQLPQCEREELFSREEYEEIRCFLKNFSGEKGVFAYVHNYMERLLLEVVIVDLQIARQYCCFIISEMTKMSEEQERLFDRYCSDTSFQMNRERQKELYSRYKDKYRELHLSNYDNCMYFFHHLYYVQQKGSIEEILYKAELDYLARGWKNLKEINLIGTSPAEIFDMPVKILRACNSEWGLKLLITREMGLKITMFYERYPKYFWNLGNSECVRRYVAEVLFQKDEKIMEKEDRKILNYLCDTELDRATYEKCIEYWCIRDTIKSIYRLRLLPECDDESWGHLFEKADFILFYMVSAREYVDCCMKKRYYLQWRRMEWEQGLYRIFIPQNVEDVLMLSNQMHNCLWSYIDRLGQCEMMIAALERTDKFAGEYEAVLEICGGVIRQAYQKFGMELKEVQKEWIIIYAQKKGLEYSAIKIFN